MTVITIVSPDDGLALAIGEALVTEGGVVVNNAAFMTPPFIVVDGTPPDERVHYWRRVGDEWVPPQLSEADLKLAREQKWDDIKIERDRRKASGVRVAASWFHSDTDSRVQWLGLKDTARDLLASGAALADPITMFSQPVQWKALSGSFVPVTVQLALDVVQATKELDAVLFKVAEEHHAALWASPDPASYNIADGWPATFGE